jgi:hypothetical protein
MHMFCHHIGSQLCQNVKPKQHIDPHLAPPTPLNRYSKTYAEMLLRLREDLLHQMAEKRKSRRGDSNFSAAAAASRKTPFVSAYSGYSTHRDHNTGYCSID